MLTKKYITRTDLKIAGLNNFEFLANRLENKGFLTADYHLTLNKVTYKINFDVEVELSNTTQRSVEKLYRKMLEKILEFKSLKTSEQKKYATENGLIVD